jgi:glycosyltransferase involved in cell wall biosynthesis
LNVVMLVKNSFEYDARVTKEARTLIGEGHDVRVVAYHVPNVTAQLEVTEDGIDVHRVTRVNLGVDTVNDIAQRFSLFIERRRASMTGTEADLAGALTEGSLGLDSTATPGAMTKAEAATADEVAAAAGGVAAVIASGGPAARPADAPTQPGRAFYVEWSTAVMRGVVKLIKLVFKLCKLLLGKQGQGLKHYAINKRFIAKAVELQPDVVHCHDLNTLWAGRQIKKQTGCKLVYDSHEMATARNRMTTGWRMWCEHFEKAGVPDADRVIMASPGYADVCRDRYGVESTVLINVPPPQAPTGTRDLRTETGLSRDDTLLIYQGSIQENRGIEQVIDAVKLINADVAPGAPGVSLVVVGYGYHRSTLERIVRDRGMGDRVRFFGPVPNPELVDWSSTADIGMCNIVGTSPSYRESLPNKLFEYVMAGIPVVVSNFGSMGRLCEEQGVGVTCDPTSPQELAAAVMQLRDEQFYERCRAATPDMAARFNWDVEQRKLVQLYSTL